MDAAGLSTMPEWATEMVDLHVHAAPSLLPRHGVDSQTARAESQLGFAATVLKAHEGSTAERAAIAGSGVYGGVVLNSPVGGANPDAVEVAARLGGRIVWMPTVSSPTHKAAMEKPELNVHRAFELRRVEVFDDGRLREEWFEVLDAVAAHDLVLASGHLSAAESLELFRIASRRGVDRMMMNHPKMAFLAWGREEAGQLRRLGVRLELGVLPDLLGGPDESSLDLTGEYPHELLVFGSDLGHAHYPTPAQGLPQWLRALEERVGVDTAHAILTSQGSELLLS